jgi:hypothetical protein
MMLSLLLACSSEVTLTIPRQTIQHTIEQRFPIEGGAEGVATLSLTQPTVQLPGAGQIGLDVQVEASWRAVSIDGAAEAVKELPEAESFEAALDQTLSILEDFTQRAAAAPMKTQQGTGGIQGSLDYRDGAFFLRDASLSRLQLDGVDAERTEQLRGLASVPLSAALDALPVYTLDADLKQKAARHVINGVVAEEAGLTITLGVPE